MGELLRIGYVTDVQKCKVNPDHVYEMFGSFNGLSAHDVRMSLLEYASENIDFFECRSTICLPMCGIGIDTWVDIVSDHRMCCDELALLGLSAMYQRHCLVVTKNKQLKHTNC